MNNLNINEKNEKMNKLRESDILDDLTHVDVARHSRGSLCPSSIPNY